MTRRDSNTPPLPADVGTAFAAFSEPVRLRLLEVRSLIYATAAQTDGVGPLSEVLKWGEPAYRTEASGSGSTIRLGQAKAPLDCGLVLFNCRTTLVETFRTHFPSAFTYRDNRAIVLSSSEPLPAEPLSMCLAMALTYHRRHGGSRSRRDFAA